MIIVQKIYILTGFFSNDSLFKKKKKGLSHERIIF